MLQRVDALLMVLGSIIFLVGALSPISLKVFSTPDAGKRLATIRAGRRAWRIDQVWYALGPIVTALGIGLVAYRFRSSPATLPAYMSFATMAIAAVPWTWTVYRRAVDPEAFTEGSLPAWPFAAYTVLTQVGLAALGTVLLRTAVPTWVSWMLIAASATLFALYLARRDMPPFIYYVLTLIAGVMLYVGG